MSKRFIECSFEQPSLLPPSVQDWLPEIISRDSSPTSHGNSILRPSTAHTDTMMVEALLRMIRS